MILATTKSVKDKIKQFEQRYKYDASYLHEVAKLSPASFEKLEQVKHLATASGTLSDPVYWVARLAVVIHCGCGSCISLNAQLAREQQVSSALIFAVIHEPGRLPRELRAIYDYAGLTFNQTIYPLELRQQVTKIVGKAGMAELSLVIALAGIFPLVKKSMGYADFCEVSIQ